MYYELVAPCFNNAAQLSLTIITRLEQFSGHLQCNSRVQTALWVLWGYIPTLFVSRNILDSRHSIILATCR